MSWPFFAIVVLLALNVPATLRISRAQGLLRSQRAIQVGLVWLVPFAGAIACLLVHNTRGQTPGRSSGSEPYEGSPWDEAPTQLMSDGE